ncbi:MAG: SIR2 family protein [Anaerolineae bacterium]
MSTVYILGAGATKAVAPRAPLMNDFLPLAFAHSAQDPRIRNVYEFVSDFYLGSPLPSDAQSIQAILPRLEDVLSQLDLCVVQNRPLSANYPLQRVQALREDLVYLIARLLKDTLEWLEMDRHATRDLAHCLTEEDAIISLNYDIIVDTALAQEFGPRRVNYGVDIRLFYHWYPDEHYEPARAHQAELSRDLYKLHGSLNWLYCPNCQALDVTLAEKGVLRIFDEEEAAVCLRCHLPYQALIITPTLLKDYANGLLLQVWRNAEERITRADRVVFIGYSLADADVEIKCMIKRATYNCWSQRGQRPTVIVVDREGAGTEAEERYRRLFGEIEYLPIGFTRYVRERIVGA